MKFKWDYCAQDTNPYLREHSDLLERVQKITIYEIDEDDKYDSWSEL